MVDAWVSFCVCVKFGLVLRTKKRIMLYLWPRQNLVGCCITALAIHQQSRGIHSDMIHPLQLLTRPIIISLVTQPVRWH